MKQIATRILLGLLLLAALITGYAYFPFREDLSGLAVPAGTYDVEILRDSYGVPHIFGQTDADVAFGLAYANAEDDFKTIQETVMAGKGELATVYGADAAAVDFLVGLLRIWDDIDAKYESDISPEFRTILDAYAAGFNHYAALHPDTAFPGLFPVTGEDIIASYMVKQPLFFGLDGTISDLFGEERKEDISPRLDHTSFLFPDPVAAFGSNAIAVAPSRTDQGQTLLAVNSHQPWSGPVSWYEVHLHSDEGWDAAGGIFPGTPSILHGHNRDIGWAFTVNSPDLTDVYLLEINPDNENQYMFDGEWRDLEVRQHPITVKLWGNIRWTVRREVLWSVYGPTVRQDHGVYAIRYATMGDVRLAEQFYNFNKATNLEEWQAALAAGPLPMFNAGYADKEGNIYYVYNAVMPLRSPHYDWSLYLPGDTSETLWTETLPFEQLPQVLNPPSGFVQNSNSTPFMTTIGPGNPERADYPDWMGIDDPPTNRSARSLALFGADESVTTSEFYTYKFDTVYVPESAAGELQRVVAAAVWDDPQLQQAADHLATWDLDTNIENRGTALGLITLYYINQDKGGYEGADFGASHLLDFELPDELVLASFEKGVAHLNDHFGRIDPTWGEVNRLRRGELDLPVSGGPDILRALYGTFGEDGRIEGNNGDGFVMLVEWDADGNVSSQSIHQFGVAVLDAESPHYADQAPLFARTEMKPVWMDEDEIRANLSRAYRP